MSTLEDIEEMQKQGISEQQIKDTLKARGLSDAEVVSALLQGRMKSSNGNRAFPVPRSQTPGPDAQESTPEEYNTGMQKSIMPARVNSSTLPQEAEQIPSAGIPGQTPLTQEYSPQIPPNTGYPQMPTEQYQYSPQPMQYEQPYDEYQPYQSYSAPSTDMMSEVAEQIVSEKLAQVRKSFEKALDAKNILGAKVDYIEERLKRIEKIIDALQSSILRKVGDYVTDVQDIKHELIETQKSMAKAFPKIKEHDIHHEHSAQGHSQHKAHRKK